MKKKYLVIFIYIFLLSACGKSVKNEEIQFTTDLIYSLPELQYTKEELLIPDYIIPYFVKYNDCKLYIIDKENDKIYVTDLEGNLIYSKGETGTEEGEFISPTVLDFDMEGNCWVVDKGNERIQVFDSDFDYIKEINLREVLLDGQEAKKDEIDNILDIKITEDNTVFLSSDAFVEDGYGVYILKKDKTIKVLKNMYSGFLGDSLQKNRVCFGTYQINNSGVFVRPPESKIFFLNDLGEYDSFSLQSNISLTDLQIYGGKYYSYTINTGHVLVLDPTDINKSYTIPTRNEKDKDEMEGYFYVYLTIDDTGVIYMNNEKNHKIVKFIPEGN